MGTFTPLKLKNKLAPTPKSPPKYEVIVKNAAGAQVRLADPKVIRALVAIMNMHAVNGGAACHWGGPAAFAEMSSALHAIMFQSSQWHEDFNFVNDAGHCENGIYALRAIYEFDGMDYKDLWNFRSIESKLTGHGESHLNPQGVYLSNGPLGSSIPQAQGLCFADKLLGNNRVTVCLISDGASMEGEAKEAFCAIAGLAAKGKMNPFVLCISDNNTKLSGRIDNDSFAMTPSFESLNDLGWDVRKVEDGHDIQAVYLAAEKAIADSVANPNKPVCLWMKTIKGYGVKSTEQSASGGHGYPLKARDEKLGDFIDEIFSGNTPNEFQDWVSEAIKQVDSTKKASDVPNEKIQLGIAHALIEKAAMGYPIFSVSADLQGSTGVKTFQTQFPENFVEVGVAESNMISMGAGLAKAGFIPVVDTFAQFGVTKGNLPLTMAALSQAPVICVFSHTGFQDAADGASHQATTYISAINSIPKTKIIQCSCSQEAHAYMLAAIDEYQTQREAGKDGQSYVFFIGRENFPRYYNENEKYEWNKAQVLCQGDAATIVTSGSLVPSALKACELLSNQGINISVINNPFVNEPDLTTIGASVANTNKRLLTVEDHQVRGGMGAILTHELAQAGYSFQVKSLGIKGEFGRSAYNADSLYDHYGIGANAMVEAVKAML